MTVDTGFMGEAKPVGDELSVAVVSLLKGPVFRAHKPDLWHTTTGPLQPRVRDHVAVLGLDLVIDEAEGYAFLRSVPDDSDDESSSPIPRLVARRPLTFEVSLLLALFRRRLAELDGSDGDADRLIMSVDEIVEMIRLFLPDTTNETRLLSRIDNHINKATELGFLRRLDKRATPGRPARYEVQRIIKAFIDGQWLSEFDRRLAEYRHRLATPDLADPDLADPDLADPDLADPDPADPDPADPGGDDG